jgi:hypothetical protein
MEFGYVLADISGDDITWGHSSIGKKMQLTKREFGRAGLRSPDGNGTQSHTLLASSHNDRHRAPASGDSEGAVGAA